MTAAHPDQLRLLPEAPPPANRRSRARGYRAAAALAVVAALVAMATLLWPRGGGLESLPREERAALVSRTVDELNQYCGPGHPEALDDHCRELAAFAAQFDECRGECEALVRRWITPAPTR